MPVTETQERGLALAAIALDEAELAAAVKRTLLMNTTSKALCRFYGPDDGCHCKGVESHCHAHKFWEPESRVMIMALERAGALK